MRAQPLRRFPDWPTRLSAAIEAARGRPFAWGRDDCCTFAAACVQAMTGTDPMQGWRERYRNAAGALRLQIKHGGLPVLINRALGEPIAPALAQRGDVVLIGTDRGFAAGICVGESAVFAGSDGPAYVGSPEWVQAWRV